MIKNIRVVDLLSVAISEIEAETESFSITYQRINHIQDRLQEEGLVCDLGAKEIDTVGFLYPDNVFIQKNDIQIKKTSAFVSCINIYLSRQDFEDINILKNLWKETK